MTLADALAGSPRWQPLVLDPAGDRALLVSLSAAEARAASFLDERILSGQTQAQWIPCGALIEAAAALPETHLAMHHIGHVGSTLIARLLGELPGVEVLREPAALRTLADAGVAWWSPAMRAARARACGALWSRTWAVGARALVKATSFASETAATYLARRDAPPGLFVVAGAEAYLATILGQDGNRAEAVALAPARLARLNARLQGSRFELWELSEGERVAVAWACETLTLGAAARLAPGRVGWLDFEAFLAEPEAGLRAAAAALGIDVGAADVAALVSGPLMGRYAKAPEQSYSPALRRAVLDDARARHGGEIARGLAWLERTGLAEACAG